MNPMGWRALPSHEDVSVNFVRKADDGGFLEARYVRRVPDYFICYLSSHTGCLKACRMCHLTASGQTMFSPSTVGDYLDQARIVLNHYRERIEPGEPARTVNFNWMARGEPLANPFMLGEAGKILDGLTELAQKEGLEPRFNISTILPDDLAGRSLSSIFGDLPVTLYYSLYSLDPDFRRRWLPRAMSGHAGLRLLADWQRTTGREVVLHWAFIEGENDAEETVAGILDACRERGLETRFNLVRYNPANDKSRESPEDVIELRRRQIDEHMPARIVQRVGFDVKASCGMFVNGDSERDTFRR